MLKKLLPALCCAALAAGCASTATTGSSWSRSQAKNPLNSRIVPSCGLTAPAKTVNSRPLSALAPTAASLGRLAATACSAAGSRTAKRSIWVKSPRRCACAVPPSWKSRRNSSSLLGAAKYITAAADGEGIVLWNDKGEKLVELLPERAGKCD